MKEVIKHSISSHGNSIWETIQQGNNLKGGKNPIFYRGVYSKAIYSSDKTNQKQETDKEQCEKLTPRKKTQTSGFLTASSRVSRT